MIPGNMQLVRTMHTLYHYLVILFVGNLTKIPYLLYLRNAYLLTASMTTTGYGDITVTYIAEALYISIILIFSKLFYSFFVGYYSVLLSLTAIQQVTARQNFNGLKVCHAILCNNISYNTVVLYSRIWAFLAKPKCLQSDFQQVSRTKISAK